jgi:hypothetical protein
MNLFATQTIVQDRQAELRKIAERSRWRRTVARAVRRDG